MKKLSLLVLSVMFFAIGNVKAQKFGHVRIDSLLLSMPEYKSAKEKGDAKLKSLQTFLSNLQNEYDQKLQKAQNDAANMSEIERKNV
ncbi:MAG: OmpH family outer membrane protein, partial [Bacteroidota bacterium]